LHAYSSIHLMLTKGLALKILLMCILAD